MRERFSASAAAFPLSRRPRLTSLTLLGAAFLAFLLMAPLAVNAEEAVQPGPPKIPGERVGEVNPADFQCEPGTGNLLYKGKKFYENHYKCPDSGERLILRSDGSTEPSSGLEEIEWKEDIKVFCMKRWDVWRFYGRDRVSHGTVDVVSYSQNVPVVPCADTWMHKFVFFAPHPNDAGHPIQHPFGTRAKKIRNGWVTFHDTKPSNTNACPIPSDNANLARYFKPLNTYKDPLEREAADAIQDGLKDTFGKIHARLISRDLIGEWAQIFMNSIGGDPRPGTYPDKLKCSSGLDAAVMDDNGDGKPDQPGYVWGVCFAPVMTMYQRYFKKDNSMIVQEHLTADDFYHREYLQKTLYPQSQENITKSAFDKQLIAAMRARITPSKGVKDGAAAKKWAPCFVGRSQVVQLEGNSTQPVKLDDVKLPKFGPSSAYVGGTRLPDFTWTVPVPTLTCNGGKDCKGLARITKVTYSPKLVSPTDAQAGKGNGWTACPGTSNMLKAPRADERECDFWMDLRQNGNGTLDVRARFFTATNKGEPFKVDFNQVVTIEVLPDSESRLTQICIGRQWAGAGMDDCFPVGGTTKGYTVTVDVKNDDITLDVDGARATGAYR